MSKVITHVELTDTLSLSECNDGFWLYDKTRSMNLSMKAKTAQDAFVETIEYYQKRLTEVEFEHKILKESVDKFVEQHCEHEDHEED